MTYRAQCILPYTSNLPQDVITNNFHFDWSGGSEPIEIDYQEVVTAIAAFYEVVYNTPGGMAAYIAPANFRVKIYNLDDPSPRPPRHEQVTALTVNQAGASAVPAETAVVTSFQGDPVAGINQARRRNRIYLGALTNAWVTNATGSSVPRLNSTVLANVVAATEGLKDDIDATASWTWVTYSPTALSTSVVTNGWVDNELDTQRRRGTDTTTRTVWP